MIQAVVCAENSLTRAGLVAMTTSATITVVGQVATLMALDTWLTRQAQLPDVVLMDCPTVTAVVCQQVTQVLAQWPNLSLLLLVDAELVLDAWVQPQLRQLLGSGALSLLPQTVGVDPLRSAIAALAMGLIVLHPDLIDWVFAPSGQTFALPAEPPIDPLSQREIEVLNQLAAGASNKAIARTLGISDHTVKFHISAILAKLGVTSRTEAVTVGIRAGLILL